MKEVIKLSHVWHREISKEDNILKEHITLYEKWQTKCSRNEISQNFE